jgi:cell division protein FtsB
MNDGMSDEPKKRSRGWIGWVLVVVLIAVGIAAWGVGRTLDDRQRARQRALARTGELNVQIRALAKEEKDDPARRREIHEEVERLVRERHELNHERKRLARSLFQMFLDLFR